jgi:hypothetical protein
MQDTHIYPLIESLYGQMRQQKAVLNETVLLIHATRSTLAELIPNFNQVFDKHQRDLATGPLAASHAQTLREVDQLFEQLH